MKHLLQLPWGGLQYITASTPSTGRSPSTCVNDKEYLLVSWFSITLSSNDGKQEEINPQDSSAAVMAYIALCFDLASRTFFWITWNEHVRYHLPLVFDNFHWHWNIRRSVWRDTCKISTRSSSNNGVLVGSARHKIPLPSWFCTDIALCLTNLPVASTSSGILTPECRKYSLRASTVAANKTSASVAPVILEIFRRISSSTSSDQATTFRPQGDVVWRRFVCGCFQNNSSKIVFGAFIAIHVMDNVSIVARYIKGT